MRIKYCKKYEKYVSSQHCEFFNEGGQCEFYNASEWGSIKDLLRDEDRPKWSVDAVIKPFQCSLLRRDDLNRISMQKRTVGRKRAIGLR